MYAILDIETTGGKYNEEGITEIAIHKFDGHQVVDSFISLINPEKEIQPFVVKLTKINSKMLKTAPKFHEVAKRIIEITKDTILVAHNAQFDYRILRTEYRRLGFNYERKTICTVDLSQKLLPEAPSYSLGKLVRSLGIAVSDRHRANGDALATLSLFKLLLAKDAEKEIITTFVRSETLGELSSKKLNILAELPTETGVYYMHNKDSHIIFLGKSTDINKRVNQHFTKDGNKARKIQKETKKVTFERTGSELVAVLKAHQEIKVNKPKYNSKQFKSGSHVLHQTKNENGYIQITAAKRNEKQQIITTFDSLVAAKNTLYKINKEFQLCDKVNGLSEARTNCANYEEGLCLGACITKESPETYNSRVQQAIVKYSLDGKNIVIIDKGRETGERSVILIKNGIFKGLGFYNLNHQINNIHILESVITPMEGNMETNHIIASYLRKKKVLKVLDLEV